MASLAARNRKIFEAIKKGDLAVSDLISDGGYLPAEEEMKFMLKVYQTTPFLNAIRTVEMTAPKRKINKIGISDDFLHTAPTSGTALDAAKRSKVFTEYVELTTSELIGVMYLPYDVIEDNIEKGRIEDTIMNELLPPKVGRSLEKKIIQGNHLSADTALNCWDGLLVQLATGSNVCAFSQITGVVTDDMFEEVLETLPDEHRENEQLLDFVYHRRVTDAWWKKRRARLTLEGDRMIAENHLTQMDFRGVPIMSCGNMPKTNGLLSNPQNFILGVQRGIQFETARDIEARVIIVVCTLRAAIGVEEKEACVLVTGLNPSATSSTTTG